MSINKNDIEKYIFDPKNPAKCKSYKLLLNIAKKENYSYFSPEILKYFFADQIVNDEFEEEIWDKPDDYNKLTNAKKIDLYKTLLSTNEYNDFVKKIDFNINNLTKYKFFKNFINVYNITANMSDIRDVDNLKINYLLLLSESHFNKNRPYMQNEELNNRHYLIFSKNDFSILKFNIMRSSIFVTLEENVDKFLEFDNKNIKPLFLKKIEDIDLLLSVIQKDLKQKKDVTKEKINFIDTIKIENFYSIKNIELKNLKDKKEIYIVGENGDGKTLFMQTIALALKGVNEGYVFNLAKSQEAYNTEIIFDNKEKLTRKDLEAKNNQYKNLLAYGASRNNNCQIKEDEVGYLTLFSNSFDLQNPIKWLIYLDHKESKKEENILSIAEAKELLKGLLEKDIEIDIGTDKVSFHEKGASVEFEQLSAGYKGVITIVCDMISRLFENQPYVTNINEFKGVVIIDEVELHLHPKWKYDFMKKIREIFPLIQFVVTTHSPTVILGASKKAVFYKIYKEDGEVSISNQMTNKGYTNNTLVSSPLFDLDTITSRNFDNKNVNDDDYIYDKIHKVISKKIKENRDINEEEILKQIDDELDKI